MEGREIEWGRDVGTVDGGLRRGGGLGGGLPSALLGSGSGWSSTA